MQENYLAKWLDNELTEEELTEFKGSEEYATYKRIQEVSEELTAPAFNVSDSYAKIKEQTFGTTETKLFTLRPYTKFLKVAAAVILLICASYFYLGTLNTSFSTDYAENKNVILPDNSSVVLNAGSEISFDKDDWDNNRNVVLNGEAFFKVAKGERFTVATDMGSVTVLGTEFNVVQRKGFFKVTCYEGLVSVALNGKETKLPAGNSFTRINGETITSTVADRKIPSWINKESSFQSIPLQYVLEEFERQHNVEVETSGINLNKTYTGTFSNTDTNLALKSISLPSQIKFKFEGKKVLFYAPKTP